MTILNIPTPSRRRACLAMAIAALLVLLVPASAPAAGRGQPALRIVSVSGAAEVAPGQAIPVSYRVSRRGRGGFRRAALVFYLSRSARSVRGAVRLGGTASLAGLRRRRAFAGRVRAAVPSSATPGSYHLVACTTGIRATGDGTRRACRAAGRKVVVHGAPAPLGPQAPVPGGGGTPDTGGPGPSPSPSPTPGPIDLDFTGPASPVTVDANADTGRTARSRIGPNGGTLTATGADGVTYRLTIPPEALLSDAEITLTPLASVDGLPLSGGLVAGAQLGPDGLRFHTPVTLELENLPAVPAGEETGFAYHGEGRELHLYAPEVDPSKTSFKLMHFSGVGIARGTDAERRAQLERDTTDAEGRLSQRASEFLQRAREQALRGDPADDLDAQLEPLWRAYHDQVIEPLTRAARTDDRLLQRAFVKWASWERQMQLLGYEGLQAERQARETDIREAIKHAHRRSYERCVQDHRLEEIETIVAAHRTAQLWGIDLGADLDTELQNCVRFELDFESSIVHEAYRDDAGAEIWRAHLRVQDLLLQPDPESRLRVHGSKDAEYLDFEIELPPVTGGCWQDDNGEFQATHPLQVHSLGIDLNVIEAADGSYEPPETSIGEITLQMTPYLTREWVYYVTCGASTGVGHYHGFGGTAWFQLHRDELASPTEGFRLTDWQRPGGSLWARKTYSRSKPLSGRPTTEQTTIEIWHRPIAG